MFSFAMTSGLASDSDKVKITILLRRAQKFGDTGPYKNLVYSFNPSVTEVFFAISAAYVYLVVIIIFQLIVELTYPFVIFHSLFFE